MDPYFWLGLIAMIVLLPMIPAIAIFKLLPSRAAVKGPFQGLKINLGGAFAAYFVLFLLLVTFFRNPPAQEAVQVWRVTGTVQFSDQEGVPFEAVRLSYLPPLEKVATDGRFDLKVLANLDDRGEAELPNLLVAAPGYTPVSVRLEPESRTRHLVAIYKPVVLKPLLPPRPDAEALSPLPLWEARP